MKYRIIHESLYKFVSSVFFEPHFIRLMPQNAPHKTLNNFSLSIEPKPAGVTELIDTENNLVHHCWFDGVHEQLSIRTESNVVIEPFNPFNLLLHPQNFQKLPFSYDEASKNLLMPALRAVKLSPELMEYGLAIKSDAEDNTLSFIFKLTEKIHSDFIIESRETGSPHDPDNTFILKNGSCRDLAWMQIHLFRNLGIASRFVSGYFYVSSDSSEFDLHAWVEVYLPGAGWIGCDPSNGIIVGQSHIPVCRSANYENTMPIEGTIRGDAKSELVTKVQITEIK